MTSWPDRDTVDINYRLLLLREEEVEMDIPGEEVEAKQALELPLFEAGLVTGVEIGLRDEENPDPEDLALRVFVADAEDVSPDVAAAAEGLPFPLDVIQRTFDLAQATTLPDTTKYRPLVSGSMVAATRFLSGDDIPDGALGCIVADSSDQSRLCGLSCFHVQSDGIGPESAGIRSDSGPGA